MKINNKTEIQITDNIYLSADREKNTVTIVKTCGFSTELVSLKAHELQLIINCMSMLRQTKAGLDFTQPKPKKTKEEHINMFNRALRTLHEKSRKEGE